MNDDAVDLYKSPRKDGEPQIKHSVKQIARQLLTRPASFFEQEDFLKRFLQAFKDIDVDKRSNGVIPQAISQAINKACSGTDLILLNEVPFKVAYDGGSMYKKLDHLVVCGRASVPKAVAIEIKSTFEFNSISAALMELALLTEPEFVEFDSSKFQNRPLRFLSKNVKCLTVSCYENQDSKPIIDALQRRLWGSEAPQVSHHNLFFTRESRKSVEQGGGETVIINIRRLMTEIHVWLGSAACDDLASQRVC